MAKRKLKWQGEEAKVEHRTLKVSENKEKPLWWSNYEVYLYQDTRDYCYLEALKITTKDGYTFYISNHHGIGIRKLRKGGWPEQAHFSFHCAEEVDANIYETTSYCGKDYEEHERDRRKWQLENYPKEFEQSERLRKLLIRH